ncbi:MAG: carboxypeptidase-like regulatory domain-containing protein [Planctomycetia bacterium]|nr:carboxypeptidase-like regulatory domain-containing protein [Planctomycetia bacterium]
MKKITTLTVLLLCVLTFVVGCGKKYIKTEGVTGTVTVDGEPVEGCNVYFIPADANGANGYARTDASGKYQLQTQQGQALAGTTPGKYKVRFDYQVSVDTGKTMEENGETIPVLDSKSAIAKKYNNENTSGYEVEVVPGANTFDFELTSK